VRLSVIVCTYNRAYAILDCLRSIEQSISFAAPIDAEVIVIDNASTDETSAVVSEWAKTCSVPVNLQLEPRKGLSAARNCGIRIAKGELLIFTDDDCRMAQDYIKDALRHDANDGEELVLRGGRVELGDPTDLPLTTKTDLTTSRWNRSLHSAKYENLGNCLLGCNMTMRKKLTQLLGEFDSNLGAGTSIAGGEDTDYIFRAYLGNISIEYVPDMAVTHYHGRKERKHGYKLFENYCIGGGALYAKYLFKDPNLCKQVLWDGKDLIRELVYGKHPAWIETGFSYKAKMYNYIVGATKYMFAQIKIKP